MQKKFAKLFFPLPAWAPGSCRPPRRKPKEMLPLVDKPIIQYGVEEAVASGCDQIIIITGRGKQAIEDHFDVSYELEKMLEERGKTDLLQDRPPDFRPDPHRLRAAERGAGPGPCRPHRARTGGRRTLRGPAGR